MKETMELLDLMKVMAECYVEAKKDGSVNWFDLPKFAPVLSRLTAAFDGADKIGEELKSLDMGKVLMIADKFREIGFMVRG
jgi:hypothetical protein